MKPIDKDDVREAVKEGISEALTGFGFTVDQPNEVQADMQHLRKHRRGAEAVKGHAVKTAVGILACGGLYGIWETLKHVIAEAIKR